MRVEKGIRAVSYKTKDGNTIKYRVRINREGYKVDKLFDSLKEAREFLALSSSEDGRKAITQFSEQQAQTDKLLKEYIDAPDLSYYLNAYYARYIRNDSTPTKSRSSSATLSRIKTILGTVLEVDPTPMSGVLSHLSLAKFSKTSKAKNIGSLKPDDITEQIATSYIEIRLKIRAVATVKREVALLRSFFNKLRYIDVKAYNRLKLNPFSEADLSLFNKKKTPQQRKRRLEDGEEDRLFQQLHLCQNSEMAQIVALALSTGMRRGEILELKWSNVGKHLISVEDAKSGSRDVVLNEQSKAVLASVKRRDDRIFHYTADGFATNWDRVKKRAGVTNLRFHDMRREFISRLVESISNPVVIAEMTTLKDANHLDKHYVQPVMLERAAQDGIKTEQHAMQSVGHKSRKMTSIYYKWKVEK